MKRFSPNLKSTDCSEPRPGRAEGGRGGAEPRAAAGAGLPFTGMLTLCRSMAGISNGISHPDKRKVILDISPGNSYANRPLILMTFFSHTSNSHTYVKGK